MLGPDPTLRCALHAAEAHPELPAVAAGLGTPLTDYLVTKALVLPTGSDRSRPLWQAMLNQPDPSSWPWSSAPRRLLLVKGDAENAGRSAAVTKAAQAAGVQVLPAPKSCPVSPA